MDKSKQPGIAFNAIVLKSLHFDRNPAALEKPNLDINFAQAHAITPDNTNLTIEITATVKERDNNSFSLSTVFVGLFSPIQGQENMALEEFAQVNGPALMFPYIRELIADITLRSGLKPVIFPPLNIHMMMAKPAVEARPS
jgi:preprotein translocase subunit SecB